MAYPEGFLDRLRTAFKGETIEKIAEILGYNNKQTVYKWGRGETKPELDKLLLINEKTQVSLHWIITGEGSPTVGSKGTLHLTVTEEVLHILKDEAAGEGRTVEDMATHLLSSIAFQKARETDLFNQKAEAFFRKQQRKVRKQKQQPMEVAVYSAADEKNLDKEKAK